MKLVTIEGYDYTLNNIMGRRLVRYLTSKGINSVFLDPRSETSSIHNKYYDVSGTGTEILIRNNEFSHSSFITQYFATMNDRISLFSCYKNKDIVVVSTSSLYTSMIEQSAMMYYQEVYHEKRCTEDVKLSYEDCLRGEEMFYISEYDLGKSEIFNVNTIDKFINMIQAIEGDTLGYTPDYTFFISHEFVRKDFMWNIENNLTWSLKSGLTQAFLESYIQFSKGTYPFQGKYIDYTPIKSGILGENEKQFHRVYITDQNTIFNEVDGKLTSMYSESEIFTDLLKKFEAHFVVGPTYIEQS